MSWKFKVLISFLFLFLTWILVAPFLANRLIVEKPLEKADAILVLSGSSVYIERTQKAAQVYKEGIADKVLLTDDGGHAGWSQKEQKNPKFVELAKRELIAQGVAEEDIETLEPQVTGTIYEAQALQKIIEENHWKSVLVVTSAYHTKRSLWTIEEVINDKNIKIGIVSSPTGQQTPPSWTWWLTRRGWSLVGGEYLKSFYYWLYY